MTSRRLALAALAFGVLALTAGGLQGWAFISTQNARSAVLAVFALSVGSSVVIAATRALRRAQNGDQRR